MAANIRRLVMLNYPHIKSQDKLSLNDQAAGLRRIMSTPKPRVVSILSTSPNHDHARLMANLATPIADQGNDVLILLASDECNANIYEVENQPTLLDVINEKTLLQSVIKNTGNGFSVAKLMPSHQVESPLDLILGQQLNTIFCKLAQQYEIVLVDAAINSEHLLPLQALNDGEIIIKLNRHSESIKDSYALIKKIYNQLGSRAFGIIVDNASEEQASTIFSNISDAARRFMQIELEYFGAIPPDVHLSRAAKLGRSVMEAFPLANASSAFKLIADRLHGKHEHKTILASLIE
jgi:flagellar biosynthesis protein FlhG